jgi:hypothetical protein
MFIVLLIVGVHAAPISYREEIGHLAINIALLTERNSGQISGRKSNFHLPRGWLEEFSFKHSDYDERT